MALNASNKLTLVDLANQIAPNGDLVTIAEALTEDNELLLDAVWMEANDIFSHKVVRRASLPTGTHRRLGGGVAIESSRTEPFTEQLAMLETYAETDAKLIDTSPNPQEFRMNQAMAFLEGLSQTMANILIYGNQTTDPEKIDGLATRMSSLATSSNVIGAGGSGGDTTSIYGVQWGPRSVHMIYPKGSQLGIKHTDKGLVTVTDATTAVPNSSQYEAYRDHFVVDYGLAVQDPRSIIRYTNIESTGTTNIFDEDELIRLLNRMPRSGAGTSLYVNDTVQTQMEISLKDKNNVNYTADAGEGIAGVRILRFRGNPVRKVDAIIITESAVS